MWVLIEGTSFSGLLWANTLKSKSVLCACSPTRLSCPWLCLQDSSDSVRRAVHLTCCSTFLGSVLYLATRNCVPIVDSGHPQLVPEKGGPRGSLCLVPQVGIRLGSGCGRVQGQAPSSTFAVKALAELTFTTPLLICAETSHGGKFHMQHFGPTTKHFLCPLCFILILQNKKNKKENRLATSRSLLTLAIKIQENKLFLSGPSLTQTL